MNRTGSLEAEEVGATGEGFYGRLQRLLSVLVCAISIFHKLSAEGALVVLLI